MFMLRLLLRLPHRHAAQLAVSVPARALEAGAHTTRMHSYLSLHQSASIFCEAPANQGPP